MGVLRIGHRGAAGHAPGNTLISIAKALRIGVDVIEVDIQRTRDDHLIVLHDRFLQPSTTGSGLVSDRSLDEIRALRTIPGDQPIPTLVEVLEAVDGHAGLMLEIKSPGIAGAVVTAVRECRFRGPVYYASFLHEEIRSIRASDSSARTIALLEGVPVHQAAFALDAQATHAGVSIESISAGFVQELQAAGLQVFVYTVDDPQQIAFARSCGVDGIISNYPDRLLSA
ncbi:MAG TPA: glycerophosphodiester phosphodiesterase [Acidobacteriaceae bacterium]|nr:glycerophosphodiester phosphodiesterase [Acidobacteriaceae bacterium]